MEFKTKLDRVVIRWNDDTLRTEVRGRHSVVLKLITQRFWSCSLDKNDGDVDDAVEMKTDAVALIEKFERQSTFEARRMQNSLQAK